MSRFAPFATRVFYTTKCGRCDETVNEEFSLYPGTVIPYPALPEGWLVLMGHAICPNHKIIIDGHECR